MTPKRKPVKKYEFDVRINISRFTNSTEHRHEMTKAKIGVNLHKFVPSIVYVTDVITVDPDYRSKVIYGVAHVRAATSDNAMTKLEKDIAYGLDSKYRVTGFNIKVRK